MRLIDADALKKEIPLKRLGDSFIPRNEVHAIIDNAPTITPDKAEYYHLDNMPDPECIVKPKDNTCGACHHLIFKDHMHREGLCNLYRLHRCFDDRCQYEEEMQ